MHWRLSTVKEEKRSREKCEKYFIFKKLTTDGDVIIDDEYFLQKRYIELKI